MFEISSIFEDDDWVFACETRASTFIYAGTLMQAVRAVI